LGVDVSLIGAVGYAVILAVALWGANPEREASRTPTLLLLALIVPAVLFTIRLKYAEWFVLRTFCPWCLESAVTIVVCLVLALLDLRRVSSPRLASASRTAR
ncbi:MAG: vitamin K epoxide reductase family protein, partial [Gemmatimonadales bacterium]